MFITEDNVDFVRVKPKTTPDDPNLKDHIFLCLIVCLFCFFNVLDVVKKLA